MKTITAVRPVLARRRIVGTENKHENNLSRGKIASDRQHITSESTRKSEVIVPFKIRRKRKYKTKPVPHNPFRIQSIRNKKVILESDLAFALGSIAARLADIACRKADWFTESARFEITADEAEEIGLWWTRGAYAPQPPAVYTMEGVIAMAHWLASYAAEETDAQPAAYDLLERFRKLRRELEV